MSKERSPFATTGSSLSRALFVFFFFFFFFLSSSVLFFISLFFYNALVFILQIFQLWKLVNEQVDECGADVVTVVVKISIYFRHYVIFVIIVIIYLWFVIVTWL